MLLSFNKNSNGHLHENGPNMSGYRRIFSSDATWHAANRPFFPGVPRTSVDVSMSLLAVVLPDVFRFGNGLISTCEPNIFARFVWGCCRNTCVGQAQAWHLVRYQTSHANAAISLSNMLSMKMPFWSEAIQRPPPRGPCTDSPPTKKGDPKAALSKRQ
jgi:hypothetical protein